MHARMKPFAHRFSYRVMSLLIDLDRLSEADRMSPLFGVNRAALQSFHEADHGPRDGSSLRAFAQRAAAAQGIDLTNGSVTLLCYPRLLGYTFNPLSVYFCRDAGGELALLIYEVRNTFGEMHHYVLPVAEAERNEPMIRQQQDKLFYVSPFIGEAMRYHFRVHAAFGRGPPPHPGDRCRGAAAGRDLHRQAARADEPRPAWRGGAATPCHIQNYRRHPLASLASVVQRRKNCSASSAWSHMALVRTGQKPD